jgi:type IV secretory pathway VirB2 component (pilin)
MLPIDFMICQFYPMLVAAGTKLAVLALIFIGARAMQGYVSQGQLLLYTTGYCMVVGATGLTKVILGVPLLC